VTSQAIRSIPVSSHFPLSVCVQGNASGRSSMPTQKQAKQSRYTPRRRLGERRYSSYLFLTSALDGGEWSASRPGRALAPGKGPPVPIVQEAAWAPEPVWTQRLEEKSFDPAGDRTPIARSSNPQSDTILTELLRLLFHGDSRLKH
jgi:hypothetical protein